MKLGLNTTTLQIHKTSLNIELFLYILIFFVLLLAYMVPETIAYLYSHPHTYQNAWDKYTYFSYQAYLTTANTLGNFPFYIIGWLQKLGISGATQNFVFDLILPPLTLWLTYKVFIHFNQPKENALCYTLLVFFSGILISHANPSIQQHFGPMLRWNTVLMGWNTFPAILRSPNPQFGYFILACAINISIKFKKLFILMLIMPLLYYFVFVPYAYLLIVLFLCAQSKKINFTRIILFNLIAYLTLAGFVSIAFHFSGKAYLNHISELFRNGREFYLSSVGIFGFIIYLFLKGLGLFKKNKFAEYAFITLIACSFAVVNFQLLTNFALSLKNYLDYGLNIIFGLMLVLMFETFRHYTQSHQITSDKAFLLNNCSRFLKIYILLFCTYVTLLTQHFDFNQLQFKINLGGQLSPAQIKKIKSDPLHAIILDDILSRKIAFTEPLLLAPVFSYMYNFAFISKQCEYNSMLVKNALDYIKNKYGVDSNYYLLINKRAQRYFQFQKEYKFIPYHHQKYCQRSQYENKKFFTIKPSYKNTLISFP